MAPSEILRPLDFVRTDVSEELIASNIRVIGIGELGITLATSHCAYFLVTANDVPSSTILATLMEAILSSETSVLTRAI
jgi:hypothetical protein